MDTERAGAKSYWQDMWAAMEEEEERLKVRRKQFWDEVGRRDPRILKFRLLTLKAVHSDRVANDSYFNILRAGFTQPELLELLVALVVLAPERGKRWIWVSELGMTTKQLKNFPSRLETMAQEIERLNNHPMLRPDVWIAARALSESQKEIFGKWFARLPLLLRYYSAFIKAHRRFASRLAWERNNRNRPQAEARSALINLIRKETGRPMLTDVSNVLNAAAGLAGRERTFDPATLKWHESSKRKKSKNIPDV